MLGFLLSEERSIPVKLFLILKILGLANEQVRSRCGIFGSQ